MVVTTPLAGVIIAGGTALQLAWGQAAPNEALIDITGVDAARGIGVVGGMLRIGALETLETCRTHSLVRAHAPLLGQACSVIGALGVRTLATLGGNIGWRQGDTIPALLALDALVETEDGIRPLEDILAEPTIPLLLGVLLPTGRAGVFEKVGYRAAFSPSVVTVAGCLAPDGPRLAAGGSGLPALRLRSAEALVPDWPAVADAIAAGIGGERGTIAARVLTGLLRA